MQVKMENGTLTIFLDGRIDSANAGTAEAEIQELLKKYQPEAVILDAEKLEYISSAGLRVVLKLRRRYSEFKVINASSEVYEIFDITGFAEMMTVEKAYRHFDVTGCKLIGEGANGWVYRYNGDTIVKVYKNADSLDEIKRERELSRTAFLLGIPTAISFDVVKVGNTYGAVFELLNAKSFDELMIEDANNLEFCAKESVKVMKMIHSTKAPDSLPHQRDETLKWLGMVEDYFTPVENAKLRQLVEELPEDGFMLHCDYHLKNLMLNNGETLLIDMDTLCTGHPIYELAFMFNAYKGFSLTDKTSVENFLGISLELAYKYWRRSIEFYFDTDDQEFLDKIEEKASLIGYLRVMRRVIRMGDENTPEGKKLVDACHDVIADLLTKVDSLTF